MSQWLDARGVHPVRSMELGVPDELLGLPRVRFVFETLANPSDDSVEHEALVVTLLAGPKSGTYGGLLLRLQL